MANEKKVKNISLVVGVVGVGAFVFFLWVLEVTPIMAQPQTSEASETDKNNFNGIQFLFLSPFILDNNTGLDICPLFFPDWEIKYNQQLRDLSNFKLEGTEIKTIQFGFAPPPTCYVIPVVKTPPEESIEVNPPPVIEPRWGVGFHGGATFPIIDLGTRYRYSYMLAANVEYYWHPQISAVVLVGFNRFRAKLHSSYLASTYWWNLSANLKWEITTSRMRPYINGGMGLYIPRDGLIRPGLNLGAGLNRYFNPNLILVFGVDYHNIIFTKLKDAEFYIIHAGLIYRL